MNKSFSDILVYPEIFSQLSGKSFCNKSVGNLSWLKVGGSAEYLYIPSNEEDLSLLLDSLNDEINLHIFGKLSNTLIRDGGISGLTILIPSSFYGIEVVSDTKLQVGSGVSDKVLANKCLGLGIGGMEFLSGIPGSIGGGVFMNAGSFGSEFKDIVLEVNFISKSGKKIIKKRNEIDFGYRKTNLCDNAIITSVLMEGVLKDSFEIKEIMNDINLQRTLSQPQGRPTGGSTFKNTKNFKAWELINKSGMSRAFCGGAIVSNVHSNFLINKGKATAKDFENLGNMIIEEVKNELGILLEWEIQIVGDNE